jgi:predicted component of viral defense system (DUF524 family)
MSLVFKYRLRTKKDTPWLEVLPNSEITLQESSKYVLQFPAPLTNNQKQEVLAVDGEIITEELIALSFNNFVGEFSLSGISFKVVSTKISSANISTMLLEISELSTSLIFGIRSPTGFKAQVNLVEHSPVPYHQLQYLRHVMLKIEPGKRLQDYISRIEKNPTREFNRHRRTVPVGQTKRLDSRSIKAILSRPDRLSKLRDDSPLTSHPLARLLTFGEPEHAHFPAEIWESSKHLSFDTLENRFVILSILAELNDSPFLNEVSGLTSLSSPSQALVKAEGYRELYCFWQDFTRHMALPVDPEQTSQLLEGNNIALLYEYWVFIRVVSAVGVATGLTPKDSPEIFRDELGSRLVNGMKVNFGSGISVAFNQSYTRKQSTTYSTPLRPDVIIQNLDKIYVFDAKYKLKKINSDEQEFDKGDIGGSYKREDLYKMHTYRDAIHGVTAAFVVYPGNEFVFFERDGHLTKNATSLIEPDGVGAIPLQPEQHEDILQQVISSLIIAS